MCGKISFVQYRQYFITSEDKKLKLFDNINGLLTIAGAIINLGDIAKRVDDARKIGDFKTERDEILKASQKCSNQIVKKLNIDINVINPELLPEDGPVVFISNHQSYADVLAFLYVIKNHQIGFIAKENLGKVPALGAWIQRIRGIFIKRGDARSSLKTINQGVSYLKDGFSLVIFPEGTRSQSSKMSEFKPGSFKLATKARVPIVPVSINGGFHLYEECNTIKKGQHIDFLVHPAIKTEGLSHQQLSEIPELVEATIRNGLAEILSKQ